MAPDSGEVGLTQRLKNTGERPASFCLWDRTACRGSGFLLLPLPKRSQYRAGYGLRQPNEPKYTDAQARPTDPRFKSIEGTLVVQARGEAFQLGADGDVGWVAYTVGRALLVKWFPVTPKGLYSNVKHVVQAAVNEKYIEVGPSARRSSSHRARALLSRRNGRYSIWTNQLTRSTKPTRWSNAFRPRLSKGKIGYAVGSGLRQAWPRTESNWSAATGPQAPAG